MMQAFSKIALIPDAGSTWFLPRLVGYNRAFDLMVHAEKVVAEDALSMGLCERVYPAAEFEARPVHETVHFIGKAGRLAGDMIHDAYPTLAAYIAHMDRYSTLGAEYIGRKGQPTLALPAFVTSVLLNPGATFVYNYFLRLGFLDGREGLLLHLYHSVYVSWKYAKAWEHARR